MTSLAKLPSEAWCKRFVYKQLTGCNACAACAGPLVFKQNRDYGWCRVCRVKVRPKASSWFRGSKLSYQQVFLLLHCWQSRQSPGSVRMATGLSYTTIHRWYWRFRALVPKDSQETPLSGIVEVDESWFGKQRYGHQTIVIGGIERASKRLKLQVIPNTEKSSILPFLQTSIVPDSLVVTDAYSSYRKVASLGYRHEVWNHGEGYFAGTNHIEATWSAMKRYLRKLYGCVPTKRLQLILNEWMARHNNPPLFTSPQAFLQSSLFRIG